MRNRRSPGDTATTRCAAWGTKAPSRTRAYTFVQFLAAEAVDELFLTLSPQIAVRKRGRNSTCAYAGDRVYAGLCSSVLTQRQAKGSASVLALLPVRL